VENLKRLVKALTNTHGISGMEQDVRDLIVSEIQSDCFALREDVLGNLIASVGAKGGYKIGVYAHMDEVGMIVRRISGRGMIHFDIVGSIDERIFIGSKVEIKTEGGKIIPGVIGNKSRHLQTSSDLSANVALNQMAIDVGAQSANEVIEMGIEVGCPIMFDTKCHFYDNNTVLAKALDNRIGCTVLITAINELNKKLENTTLYGIFTCQEEVGARGASVAGFGLDLDLCITLDTVPVQNTEQVVEGEVNLGGGPVIRLLDWNAGTKLGMITDKKISQRLRQVAQSAEIPHQIDVLSSTYLDSSTAHLTGSGIPGGSICFPRRYSHTAVEMSNMNDVESAVKLLCEFILSLDKAPIVFGKNY